MLGLNMIEPFYFFIAIFIGFFMTYVFTPPPKIIYKYPTPDNQDELVYKDKSDNCFKYKTTEISCPKDRSKVSEIPIQNNK